MGMVVAIGKVVHAGFAVEGFAGEFVVGGVAGLGDAFAVGVVFYCADLGFGLVVGEAACAEVVVGEVVVGAIGGVAVGIGRGFGEGGVSFGHKDAFEAFDVPGGGVAVLVFGEHGIPGVPQIGRAHV